MNLLTPKLLGRLQRYVIEPLQAGKEYLPVLPGAHEYRYKDRRYLKRGAKI